MGNADINKTFKRVCNSHGWSYCVFWRFDPHNHTMLTMEEAYCEEHAGSVVASMVLQVHSLGQGLIGGAAVDGKHRWLCADAISWDVSEFGLQFSSGIKTIVVVPVELQGVLQLGSVQEISETWECVNQVRNVFLETLRVVPVGSVSSSLISEVGEQTELFGTMSSSRNSLCGDVCTSWANTVENGVNRSVFDLLDAQFGPYSEKAREGNGDKESFIVPDFGSLVSNRVNWFKEQFAASDFPPPSTDEFQMDHLTQWLADSSELGVTSLDVLFPDDTTLALGLDDKFVSIHEKEQACSLQSSLSYNAGHSCEEVDILAVNVNNDPWAGSLAGCMGNMHSVAAPCKGLFSELGLEHLLRDEKGSGNCFTKSCIDHQWPPSKKRRVEGFQRMSNYFQQTDPLREPKLKHPPCSDGQIQDFGSMKECLSKSQSRLYVEQTRDMDAKSCITTVNSNNRRPDEPAKKRAKPGQSKKPRPKDRQQIAERINNLRDLIPNAAKLSIDALLSRTIKHMDYLQNLTKHADKIKQGHEPKLIGQGNGLVQNDGIHGATWAFEVGGSNTVCPIIVEDLDHPCQMLIEMLCEEREYFLEMADIVKGFGLTILKGVLEERNDNIWAQFTVEAKKPVERVRVFMSLMQILQGPRSSQARSRIEPQQLIDSVSVSPFWGNYQHQVLPISI